MVIASVSDLLEPLDEVLHEAVALLQKWVKCGLDDNACIAFYEAGFADRVVASVLGEAFPAAIDRAGVRLVCRNRPVEVDGVLAAFPAYFQSVAQEMRAG